MKSLEYLVAALSFVVAISFVAATASANIPHNARKDGTRISLSKKHGPAVKESIKTHNLKKSRLKAGQRMAIKGNKHARHKMAPEKKRTASKKLSGHALKISSSANSARLEQVRKFTVSEDLLADLSVEERLVLFAKKMLRFPYYFGGNGAMGLDCSSYVQRVYSFVGRNIPRSAREQFTLGEAIDREDLEIGDLVFFRTYAAFPSHVGIYLGNDLFIHASSASRNVTINSLETPYYVRRYIGAKRIVPVDEIALN